MRPLTIDGVSSLARENAAALFEALGPLLPVMALIGFVAGRKSAFMQLTAAAVVGFAFTPLAKWQRMLFGASALAILIPPNAFPGAAALDWIGLGAAVALLAVNFALARSRKREASHVRA